MTNIQRLMGLIKNAPAPTEEEKRLEEEYLAQLRRLKLRYVHCHGASFAEKVAHLKTIPTPA